MKVLLNIDSLAPPLSGIGTYTYHLAKHLEQHPEVASLAVFPQNRFTRKAVLPAVFRRALRRIPFSYEMNEHLSASLLRRKQFAKRLYVYHEPSYIPVPYDGALVVTGSDLSHYHFPHYHPRKRVRWLEWNLERTIQAARQVICLSNFVRDEIVDLYGIPPEKISVVYPGVSNAFCPHALYKIAQILRKYSLDGSR